MIGLAASGLLAYAAGQTSASLLLLSLFYLQVIWFIHDICHWSVFADYTTARSWTRLLSLIMGIDGWTYFAVGHPVHHVHTNVLGYDQALETLPFVFDPASTATVIATVGPRVAAWWFRMQAAVFYLVVPIVYPPVYMLKTIVEAASKGEMLWCFAYCLRATLAITTSHGFAMLMAPTVLGAALGAVISTLNHFALPIEPGLGHERDSHVTGDSSASDDDDIPNGDGFARHVFMHTQSIRGGPLLTWLSGHLDYHVEHHLAPTMPRYNLPLITDDIKRLCVRHNITFLENSAWQAVKAQYNRMQEPGALYA